MENNTYANERTEQKLCKWDAICSPAGVQLIRNNTMIDSSIHPCFWHATSMGHPHGTLHSPVLPRRPGGVQPSRGGAPQARRKHSRGRKRCGLGHGAKREGERLAEVKTQRLPAYLRLPTKAHVLLPPPVPVGTRLSGSRPDPAPTGTASPPRPPFSALNTAGTRREWAAARDGGGACACAGRRVGGASGAWGGREARAAAADHGVCGDPARLPAPVCCLAESGSPWGPLPFLTPSGQQFRTSLGRARWCLWKKNKTKQNRNPPWVLGCFFCMVMQHRMVPPGLCLLSEAIAPEERIEGVFSRGVTARTCWGRSCRGAR